MKVFTGSNLPETDIRESRYQLGQIQEYLVSPTQEKVCTLYGLRRTGKTTIMLQAVKWLIEVQGVSADEILWITGEEDTVDTMVDLRAVLDNFKGKFVFIDEIGYFGYFIERAAILYDFYTVGEGKKLVIAGTNVVSIFVSRLSSMYGRQLLVRMPALSFFEHCKFVLKKEDPTWDEFITYLQHGGLFEQTLDVGVYLATSVVCHLEETLEDTTAKNLYPWINTKRFLKRTSWTGILNSLLLCSADSITGKTLQKTGDLSMDLAHIHTGRGSQAAHMKIQPEIIKAFREEYAIQQGMQLRPSRDELDGLMEFCTDCGLLLRLNNISGSESKCYTTIPAIRYSFTAKLSKLIAGDAGDKLKGATKPSQLLGALVGGCIISEYAMAFPERRIWFWREPDLDNDGVLLECDLLIGSAQIKSDLMDPIIESAYEIKLTRSHGYKGFEALKRLHPEWGPMECRILAGEEAKDFIYALGAHSYGVDVEEPRTEPGTETNLFSD